jgi:hypothetical protein
MKLRTIVVAGAGVATGMVVANYLTNGAVMEAVSDVVANAKERFSNKSVKAIEVVSDAIDDAGEKVIDVAESL